MAYAITQACCSDASCVAVCPVNCIHPTPDEPDFATAEMLYVDPRACIDCGACADACPVDAAKPIDALLGADTEYAAINAAHFGSEPTDGHDWADPQFPASLEPHAAGLRVAVVGTGPAASYTAAALLNTAAEVTMLDRLPVPGGLVRFGVAPDHVATKAIAERFATLQRHPRMHLLLNVEVGRDVTHAELARHHDAVVYAVGAVADRALGVPGEDLPGSLPARTFVGWYNAHPDVGADLPGIGDLAGVTAGRAVVVGNGNVALDMARILLTDPDRLAGTDIADHALAALRRSTVTEVVLVARRGPGEAAYTLAELRELVARDDLEVMVDGDEELARAIEDAPAGSKTAALRGLRVAPVDFSRPAGPARRLVLRFDSTPREAVGVSRVTALDVVPTGASDGQVTRIPTGLLLRSIGYRSEPVPGLPFDHDRHVVPNTAGRVLDPATSRPLPATYVVGWVKRGPTGGIGSNRTDAAETVSALIDDANERRISSGRGSWWIFRQLVRRRQPGAVGSREVARIDRVERAAGAATGRPRVKLASVEELLASARAR